MDIYQRLQIELIHRWRSGSYVQVHLHSGIWPTQCMTSSLHNVYVSPQQSSFCSSLQPKGHSTKIGYCRVYRIATVMLLDRRLQDLFHAVVCRVHALLRLNNHNRLQQPWQSSSCYQAEQEVGNWDYCDLGADTCGQC